MNQKNDLSPPFFIVKNPFSSWFILCLVNILTLWMLVHRITTLGKRRLAPQQALALSLI